MKYDCCTTLYSRQVIFFSLNFDKEILNETSVDKLRICVPGSKKYIFWKKRFFCHLPTNVFWENIVFDGSFAYKLGNSYINTVHFGYKGQLVPYIRMSLITDGPENNDDDNNKPDLTILINTVHFGQMDRKNRPSYVKVPYIRSLLYVLNFICLLPMLINLTRNDGLSNWSVLLK